MTVGGREVKLSRDVAIAVNPFEPHAHNMMGSEPGGRFLAFYLEPDWVYQRRGLNAIPAIFVNPTVALNSCMHGRVMGLLNGITNVERMGQPHLYNYEVTSFIDRILDAAEADRQRQHRAERASVASDFRVRKAIELMKADLTNRISFDKVARSVGLSRAHFFALFKLHTNVTPNIFWNMLRMEAALEHIQESEDRLTEIAIDLGFTTQGNFSRFFRGHVGVPPAVYRSAVRSMVG